MWNFLLALFAGSAIGSTRTARQSVKPILILFFFGVLIAGVIYVCVVFKAVSERSNTPHVSTHSSH
jgi:hypothetical protein